MVHMEKLFSKSCGLCGKKLKKKNYSINVVFYIKQIVESLKLTKTFITMKLCDG